MPVEVGIWKITDDQAERIHYAKMESETKLENVVEKDSSILGEDVLIIGRQVLTSHGKYIDLLALDEEGKVTIFELKRDRTPREVVAQVLDYASWVQALSYDEIVELYEEHYDQPLEEAFATKFDTQLPDELNSAHRMVIVCTQLDPGTERIINYLSANYGVPINAMYFRYFKEGNQEFLTRTWLIDPTIPEPKPITNQNEKKKEPWNGRDFVVNFEDGPSRSWNDAVKYGFVSAGNGKWYSQTLNHLFVGARIFCMIPKEGYVGIGTVIEKAVPVKDAVIVVDGEKKKLLDCDLMNDNLNHDLFDMDKCEYVVAVEWQKTVQKEEAFWIKGLRSNQNSAFKLRNQYTIDKVEEFFGVE